MTLTWPIAGLTTTGIISRTSGGAMSTRTITGTATRISVNEGGGIGGNPTIDLITTAVTQGDYNTGIPDICRWYSNS